MNEKQILQQENKALRAQLEEAKQLLSVCRTQVGTILGEQIDELTSKIEGRKFNKKAWDMADKNGEQ